MSIAIVGSSHVLKLQQQLQSGAIYNGGEFENFPRIEWLGKSGLTASELSDMGSPVTRRFKSRLQYSQVQIACLIIGGNDLDQARGQGHEDGDNATETVYSNIKKIVEWMKPYVEHVIVVPLSPRVHPRDSSCPFGRKYPGSAHYGEDLLTLRYLTSGTGSA